MRKATQGPNTLHPPPNEQSDFDDNLLEEGEAFEGEDEDDVMEEIDR